MASATSAASAGEATGALVLRRKMLATNAPNSTPTARLGMCTLARLLRHLTCFVSLALADRDDFSSVCMAWHGVVSGLEHAAWRKPCMVSAHGETLHGVDAVRTMAGGHHQGLGLWLDPSSHLQALNLLAVGLLVVLYCPGELKARGSRRNQTQNLLGDRP